MCHLPRHAPDRPETGWRVMPKSLSHRMEVDRESIMPWDDDEELRRIAAIDKLYEDSWLYKQEAAEEAFLQEELRRIAEEPVFLYLATYGDAVEARVKRCLDQARTLSDGGR